jgi:hypothetical protein
LAAASEKEILKDNGAEEVKKYFALAENIVAIRSGLQEKFRVETNSRGCYVTDGRNRQNLGRLADIRDQLPQRKNG